MDGVRTFPNKTGSKAGSTHLQIIPTSRIWSSNFISSHSSPFSEALHIASNSSRKHQLCILSCTHGLRDKHSARPCYVTLLSKVLYKQILSYRKRMTKPTAHATVRQKRKNKKTMSLNHTTIINISYTTEDKVSHKYRYEKLHAET
jgi:hypothetical protein